MFDPSLQTIWGGGNLTAVFCDTGWEHPDTYKHVNDVCLQMGVRLITLKSKYDFVSLAAHKKRFPSTNARFCTSELKMKPMIDYVLSLKESCIIIHRTVDRTLSGKDLAKFGEMNFVQGAEWKSKQSLWISVKERLPEPNKEVLLYDKNSIRHYVIGWLRRDKGYNPLDAD